MIKRIQIIGFVVGISMLCSVFAPVSYASPMYTYEFAAVTNNSGVADALVSQLFVDVSNGDGVAKFRFRNEGPIDSYIADIYFVNGALLGADSILDKDSADPFGLDPTLGHLGVDFDTPASPAQLPGAPADFVATNSYTSADPASSNLGVDDGVAEWVQINFELQPGQELVDILDAMSLTDPSNALRIGLHVQGISGFSDSFINVTSSDANSVPEPATLALLGLGFGFLRRKSKRNA